MPRLYLRTQSSILDSIRDDVRDDTNAKWTKAEIYRAMNRTIDGFAAEYIPVTSSVTFTNSQTATLSEVIASQHVQPEYSDTNSDLWYPIGSYDIDTDSDGNLVLRLPSVPGASVRIRYWVGQTPVPAINTMPTIVSGIGSGDTSMVLSLSLNVAPCGFVKINNEWLQYTAIAGSGSQTLLSGLRRGMYGTTAASHTAGDSVEWGIAANTQAGFEYLRYQTLAHLYAQLISPSRSAETGHYQWLTQYNQQLADEKRPVAFLLPPRIPHMPTAYGQVLSGRSTGLRGDGVYW